MKKLLFILFISLPFSAFSDEAIPIPDGKTLDEVAEKYWQCEYDRAKKSASTDYHRSEKKQADWDRNRKKN